MAVDLAGLVDLVGLSSRFEASDLAGAAHNGAKGCKMDPALLLKAPKGLLKSPDEVSELMLAGLEAWEQNPLPLGPLRPPWALALLGRLLGGEGVAVGDLDCSLCRKSSRSIERIP